MIERKAKRYRLCPTPEQALRLGQWIGAVRFTYNLALEQRRDWWRPGRRFNFASQCREVTALRAEVEWLKDVHVHALQQAVRDVEQSYKNWWAGRAKAPTPRKRGINDSMRFGDPQTLQVRRLTKNLGEVRIPKLGWVRLRWDGELPGNARSLTISCKAGCWFASIACEKEVETPTASNLPAVGIDRGIAVFAAFSDGTLISPANHGKKALRALARAQKNLARKKKGSANRRKAVMKVARLHLRVKDARKDFLHKLTTTIAKNHGTVVIENLQVGNMTRSAAGSIEEPGINVRQKAGLNRAILDQSWGLFRTLLEYKLVGRDGTLIEVPAHHTSQTCSACGHVAKENRQSREKFACAACGHQAHADVNAAINILSRAGSPVQPAEASP